MFSEHREKYDEFQKEKEEKARKLVEQIKKQ
jgi:hypothetical protein